MDKVRKVSDVEAARRGSGRLLKALSGDWWDSFEPDEAEKLESLLNHLATSFTTAVKNKKEVKNPAAIDAVDVVLVHLAAWADRATPTSPSVSKIKNASARSTAQQSEKTSSSKTEVAIDEKQPKRDVRSAAETKLQRSVDGLSEQISKVASQIEHLQAGVHHLLTKVPESKNLLQDIAEQVSNMRFQLQALHQIGLQIQAAGVELASVLSHRFETLDSRLLAIEGKLDQRVHIRDTIHILEIKQEVERFVEADLIKKISKQVMPALSLVKDAAPVDLPRSVADLESRCLAAGLIPLDRLFA
jgi:DNA repair exonuclease SbcCD ATPase subunit